MDEANDILATRETAITMFTPHERIDRAELFLMANGGKFRPLGGTIPEAPLTHHFTPGLYGREIFMPAGLLVVTHVHRTEHQFVISRGRVSVFREDGTAVELCAPYNGTTYKGTRRLLYIHEDTVWTTFHPTELTNVQELEEALFECRNDWNSLELQSLVRPHMMVE